MISFIISSFNKPLHFLTCITSLLVQGDIEIIVCDNTTELSSKERIKNYVNMFKCIKYIDTAAQCPPNINAGYMAQNIGAAVAKGQWLCFPSEDCYYVPGFSRIMLQSAKDFNWDLIYCDMLYDPRYNSFGVEGIYSVVPVYPRFRFIDKSNFIVRKKLFKGFNVEDPYGYGDWLFIQELLVKRINHGKAPGVLMVHN